MRYTNRWVIFSSQQLQEHRTLSLSFNTIHAIPYNKSDHSTSRGPALEILTHPIEMPQLPQPYMMYIFPDYEPRNGVCHTEGRVVELARPPLSAGQGIVDIGNLKRHLQRHIMDGVEELNTDKEIQGLGKWYLHSFKEATGPRADPRCPKGYTVVFEFKPFPGKAAAIKDASGKQRPMGIPKKVKKIGHAWR